MRTTITLREDLLNLAKEHTQARSITAAINEALEDWARRLRIDKIKGMAGKVNFDLNARQLRDLETQKSEKRDAGSR